MVNENTLYRLIDALGSIDPRERIAAIEQTAALGDEIIPVLVNILGDENELRFAGAAEALMHMDVERVMSHLIEALTEEDELLRDGIVMLLRNLGQPAIDILTEALMADDEWLVDSVAGALQNIGEAALLTLINALHDSDVQKRIGAAVVLGRMKDDRAVEPLIATLHDSNMWVRRCAAIALGKIGTICIDPLMAAFTDPDVGVRVSAAYALSQMGESALMPLLEALQHNNPIIRVYAAHALGDLGNPNAIPYLQAALEDGDNRVQRSAEKALAKLQLT